MSKVSQLELNETALATLADRLPVPNYDRNRLEPAILHMGVGGFHRAHLAAYTDTLLNAGKTDWCINGVGLTSADARMASTLHEQDGLYTLVARGPSSEEARIVGSITRYFHAPNGAGELCRQVADGDYRIISLTVTENGYRYTGDDRHLDLDDPVVVADLKHPDNPSTAVGFLFRIAQLRIQEGGALPTFLSCDNLPHNGATLRNLVLQYAREVNGEMAAVLEDTAAFPNCMVDRITPTTVDADRAYVREKWGIKDGWPVMCEDFIQWFIEDSFVQGRPDWSEVGAAFVSDVTPYELMKIRLLNGSHSALSYTSYLLGHRAVHHAMADTDVLKFVRRYMAEIEPAVGSVPGVDLGAYRQKLIERFSNPAVGDQVLRLAQDGSRKIPNMMLEPISLLLQQGLEFSSGAFALAAWIRYLTGRDEAGETITIDDPAASVLQEAARNCGDSALPFLTRSGVFPESIRANREFLEEIDRWYSEISARGTRAAIQRLVG